MIFALTHSYHKIEGIQDFKKKIGKKLLKNWKFLIEDYKELKNFSDHCKEENIVRIIREAYTGLFDRGVVSRDMAHLMSISSGDNEAITAFKILKSDFVMKFLNLVISLWDRNAVSMIYSLIEKLYKRSNIPITYGQLEFYQKWDIQEENMEEIEIFLSKHEYFIAS